jgi:hypothetical protein
MAYEWRQNMACVATWTIMQSPKFLNQFDGAFDKSADKKMSEMRYFPKITGGLSPDMMKGLALGMAQQFIVDLVGSFTKLKQNRGTDSADLIRTLAAVFSNGDKTMTDLAEAVDSIAKFPDEK